MSKGLVWEPSNIVFHIFQKWIKFKTWIFVKDAPLTQVWSSNLVQTLLSNCFLPWIWSTLKNWRKQYWRVFVHISFMCPKCPINLMLYIEYGIPELEPLFAVLTTFWQLSALGPFPMSLHHIGMNVCHTYNIQKYVLKYPDYFWCCR